MARTSDEINRIKTAIYVRCQKHQPLSIRNLFYLLCADGVIDKTEADYKNVVCRLAAEMRRSGDLPMDWIVDHGRMIRRPVTYSSVEEALQVMAYYYRRSLWSDSELQPILWCEKDALIGVVKPVTDEMDVPLLISRGFASISYIYQAAQMINESGKTAACYVISDYDASGMSIAETIKNQLEEYIKSGVRFFFKRIAVTKDQIQQYNLQTRPPKKQTHDLSWKDDCVDADAMPPELLRQIVQKAIEQHIDEDLWDMVYKKQKADLELLENLADHYGGGND